MFTICFELWTTIFYKVGFDILCLNKVTNQPFKIFFLKNSKLLFVIFLIVSYSSEIYSQETFADNFDFLSYANNTGTQLFSGEWVEDHEPTDPAAGTIQIFDNRLRIREIPINGRIVRNLDLSNYRSATLTLNYDGSNRGDESIVVQFFDGTEYITEVTLSDGNSISYDLAPEYINANSSFRFISGSNRWNDDADTDEEIFIDNVIITAVLNQPPVVTGAGNQIYCPQGSVPIAESISITDPDDTETTDVFIQISSGYVEGEDILTLTGVHPNITSFWNAMEGELTLSGPATYSEFEAAILATEFSSSAIVSSGTKQFSITVGDANFLPSTGHYYEFVADQGITWSDALVTAGNRTYFGLQGYLATLTTQEEADFSGSQAQGVGWIGATDEVVEGEWRWASGPEAGTQFWNGAANGTELTFAFWNTNEPNNQGGEDYAHITHSTVGIEGSWNDLTNMTAPTGVFSSQGYVVEYGGLSGDPILNLTATTTIQISRCSVITNKRITYRVKRD